MSYTAIVAKNVSVNFLGHFGYIDFSYIVLTINNKRAKMGYDNYDKCFQKD